MRVDKRLAGQTQPVRSTLILTISLGFLAGVVVVAQAYYLAKIISGVFLDQQTLTDVAPLLGALVALGLVRAAFTWGGDVAARRVAGHVKTSLRERLAAHLLALGPTYAHGERSGELANTTVEGVEALDAYFSQYLPQVAKSALIPLTILLVVFPLDLTSGLVLLLTAPIIPIFMVLIGSLAGELTKRQWKSLSRMSAHFLDVLQGLTTLKIFGRSKAQIKTIAHISHQFGDTTMKVLRVAFLSALVLELVASLSTAVVAVEVGLRLLYGHLPFEMALFVLILAPEFYAPLRALGASFHASMAGVEAADRIFEVLNTPLPADTSPALAQSQVLPLLRHHIRFSQVGYNYEDSQRAALNNISFDIKPGQTAALVGPSGAGKSTIAHALLRFIEPTAGAITVDGHPLPHLDVAAWRAQIAWVPQRPYLFNTTIAQNIALARPDASHEQIVTAARQAQADAFIRGLPHGYETLIGERGARLSGGQAQLVALARAFLKDAPILLLDEATANLDPELEQTLQAAIEQLLQSRTSLIIAHRLSTVYQADQILVLSGGRVIDAGTHAELSRRPGLYRQMLAAYHGQIRV